MVIIDVLDRVFTKKAFITQYKWTPRGCLLVINIKHVADME